MPSSDTASKVETGDYALELQPSESTPTSWTRKDVAMVMNMAVICVSWHLTVAYVYDKAKRVKLADQEGSDPSFSLIIAMLCFNTGFYPAFMLGFKWPNLIGVRSGMAAPVILYISVWLLQTQYELVPVLAWATGLVQGTQFSRFQSSVKRLTASPARTMTGILFFLSMFAPLTLLAAGTKWDFLNPDLVLTSTASVLAIALSSFCAYNFPESASHRMGEESGNRGR